MRKSIKLLFMMMSFAVVFLFAWRIMPKIWPGIKEMVVYPVFPQMRPEPEPTQEPYVPKSDFVFGDPIFETDSVIYYFYKDNCYYCRMLSPLMAGLPKQIVLSDGTLSEVKLICLNKKEDRFLQIITDYYEENSIEKDNQTVPAMIIGDQYIVKSQVIIDQLMDALVAGKGLNTPLLDGNERQIK